MASITETMENDISKDQKERVRSESKGLHTFFLSLFYSIFQNSLDHDHTSPFIIHI